jgi:S1-C subfamily serine protease
MRLISLLLVACFQFSVVAMEVSPPRPYIPEYKTCRLPTKWYDATVRIKINGHVSGTGVAIGPNLIATAWHVVDDAKNIEIQIRSIKFKASAWIGADVIAKDKNHDCALLGIDATLMSWVDVVENPRHEVLDETVAFGASGGGAIVPSLGFFAGDEPGDVVERGLNGLWVTSNPVFFGNSGGPVFNLESGELMGLVVAIYSAGGRATAPNVCLVTPIKHVYKLMVKSKLV